MQKIVCESGSAQVVFAYADPIWLVDVEGITEAEFDVSTEQLSGENGETYTGSAMKKRPITITANIFGDYAAQRAQLLSFFQRGTRGTLYFYEDSAEGKKISYYAEKISFDFNGVVRSVTVSLICPRPLFLALEPVVVPMSYWLPKLRFPFTYSPPFKVGERVANQIVTINNPQNVPAGLKITFKASGTVKNPSMTEINSGKGFRLTADMPPGSEIVVTTGIGEKGAYYVEDTYRGEIWNVGDTWLQLQPGENIYRYGADSGLQYLDVTIEYTPQYWGA